MTGNIVQESDGIGGQATNHNHAAGSGGGGDNGGDGCGGGGGGDGGGGGGSNPNAPSSRAANQTTIIDVDDSTNNPDCSKATHNKVSFSTSTTTTTSEAIAGTSINQPGGDHGAFVHTPHANRSAQPPSLTNTTLANNLFNNEEATTDHSSSPPLSKYKPTILDAAGAPAGFHIDDEAMEDNEADKYDFVNKACQLGYSNEHQCGILISAGYASSNTLYPNPFCSPTSMWTNEEQAARKIIIPSILRGADFKTISGNVMKSGFIELISEDISSGGKVPTTSSNQGIAASTINKNKNVTSSPNQESKTEDGKESINSTTKHNADHGYEHKSPPPKESDVAYTMKIQESDVSTIQTHQESGQSHQESSAAPSTHSSTGDDDLENIFTIQVKQNKEGYEILHIERGNMKPLTRPTRIFEANSAVDEPTPPTDHVAITGHCDWEHARIVLDHYDECNWTDPNTDMEGFVDETKQVFEGYSKQDKQAIRNLLVHLTPDLFDDLKASYTRYKDDLKKFEESKEQNQGHIVYSPDPEDINSKVTKREYWKSTKKRFITYVKPGNEKSVSCTPGSKIKIISINDFQRFGYPKEDGTDDREYHLLNKACQLLTEFKYEPKTKATDPFHRRGLNIVEPQLEMTDKSYKCWCIGSKQMMTWLDQSVQLRSLYPLGADADLTYYSGNALFKMNYQPNSQIDCPRVLQNMPPFQGGPPINYMIDRCKMTDILSTRDGSTCADHPDGCGKHIVEGDLVYVWGEDGQLVRGEVLYNGVWLVDFKTLQLKCRIGVVRILPHQVEYFQNRIGVVSNIETMHTKLEESKNLLEKARKVSELEQVRKEQEESELLELMDTEDEDSDDMGDGTPLAPMRKKRNAFRNASKRIEAIDDPEGETKEPPKKKARPSKTTKTQKITKKSIVTEEMIAKYKKTPPQDQPTWFYCNGIANIIFMDGTVRVDTTGSFSRQKAGKKKQSK